MTYLAERHLGTTYAKVGGIPYEVPGNYPAEPIDDTNWKPNTDVDCWVITLATKKLSAPPFQIRWRNKW